MLMVLIVVVIIVLQLLGEFEGEGLVDKSFISEGNKALG